MKYQNFVLLLFSVADLSHGDNITYYEDIINKQVNASVTYIYSTNSLEYKPKSQKAAVFGEYDFIIVGAGATGTVIAKRLSEISKWKILLLEAGDFGNDVTDIPNMGSYMRLSDYNWGYKSVLQNSSCLDMVGQRCIYPRGKGIGGSTLINGLVYARGSQRDFNQWAAEGNPGWSFNEIFPYFKKSEHFNKTDPDAVVDVESHGTDGYLSVEYPIPRHPLTNTWLEANTEKGYKIIDYNGDQHIGTGVGQLMTKNGRRADVGNAFIKPFTNRSNLTILTNSFVTKILVFGNNKTAHGVQFTYKGKTYIAKITKEVILSAGSINSPQLLMLSGIGPASHLRQIGIPLIQNLEVGSTLRDHAAFYGLYFDSNYTKTHLPLSEYLEDYFNGTGALATPNLNSGFGFYQTKFENHSNHPDLEIQFNPIDQFTDTLLQQLGSAKEKTWKHLNSRRSFLLYVIALHTKSLGTVRLRSSNPFEYPLIDGKLLSDPLNRDIDTLYEGIKLALNLTNTQAFAKINATLFKQDLPACDQKIYLSEGYWYCVLRYFTANLYHPVGTCPMGLDSTKGAVVDAQSKVHGIKKLRVADASIFPFTLSGHPTAPCVLIGEKVSDLIKLEYSHNEVTTQSVS